MPAVTFRAVVQLSRTLRAETTVAVAADARTRVAITVTARAA